MKLIYCMLILFINFFSVAYAAEVNFVPDQAVIIKPYSVANYNREFQTFYSTHPDSHSTNLYIRLEADSGFFLGKPYVFGALGEGPAAKFDKSPLYRTDAFDCMTYVSTILAMVESTNFQQFRDHMLDIQYRSGLPSYLTRNHFTSVDWNVYNQKNGYLTDYTRKLFPKTYVIATALINRPQWFSKLRANNLKQFHSLTPEETKQLLAQLRALGQHTKPEMSHLAYVPLTVLFDKSGKPLIHEFNKIPAGAVIEIVRPNWNLHELIGTNLNVSHMGFAIRIHNQLIFREASSVSNKVIDAPMMDYLAGYLKSDTVKGINIELINLVNV